MSNIANGRPADAASVEVGGYALWSVSGAGAEIRLIGRGPSGPQASRGDVLAASAGVRLPVAWARQVHGSTVLEAASPAGDGPCGEGDALVTAERGLALAIATADCVPVLLASPSAIAAAHAGWRGVVAGVVPNAVAALRAAGATPAAPSAITAWIGPAIGACCYEVGDEVARAIAAASSVAVVTARPSGRPHLDLAAAVLWQLHALGVTAVRSITACTRCDTARLWSYRRDGRGAGRNLAFVWRPPDRSVRGE